MKIPTTSKAGQEISMNFFITTLRTVKNLSRSQQPTVFSSGPYPDSEWGRNIRISVLFSYIHEECRRNEYRLCWLEYLHKSYSLMLHKIFLVESGECMGMSKWWKRPKSMFQNISTDRCLRPLGSKVCFVYAQALILLRCNTLQEHYCTCLP